MPSASSQTISRSSTSTLGHQWDPLEVLEIHWIGKCIGWAHSKNRECHNSVNRSNRPIFEGIIRELSSQPLDAFNLQPKLRELARHGLCQGVHQPQLWNMVQKWTALINARSIELEAAAQRSRTGTRSTTALATAQPFHVTSSNRSRRSPSVTTLSTMALSAQSEAESLQRSIDALYEQIQPAQRRRDCLLAPGSPRMEPSRSLARVQTDDVPSLRLLSTSSDTSSASSMRNRHSNSSTRTTSPAQSTSSRHSTTSTSSSYPSPPPSPTPGPFRRAQPTTLSSTSIATSQTDSSTPLTRGLNVARQGSASSQATPAAPQPGPSQTSPESIPRCSTTHVRRIPVSDECPICYSDEPLSSHPAADLVWCTSSCGRTVHKSCFEKWAAQCEESYLEATCPICRADWAESCACGGRSTCSTVHVERRPRTMSCPICAEDMSRDDERELQWCKDGCGQNVHRECMDAWGAHCVANASNASCTMCRAEWSSACSC